jgi:hypothetical protein
MTSENKYNVAVVVGGHNAAQAVLRDVKGSWFEVFSI